MFIVPLQDIEAVLIAWMKARGGYNPEQHRFLPYSADHLKAFESGLKDNPAAQKAWQSIQRADALIVPSVLLFRNKHTVEAWYETMKDFNLHANEKMIVFPLIHVEEKMENKHCYFTSDSFLPHKEKKTITLTSGNRINVILSGTHDIVAPSCIITLDQFNGLKMDADGEINEGELAELLKMVCQMVLKVANEAEHEILPDGYYMKGATSTRGQSSIPFKLTDDLKPARLLKDLLYAKNKCCKEFKHPAVIIQCHMKALEWEARWYFAKLVHLFTLYTQPDYPNHRMNTVSNLHLHEHYPWFSLFSSFNSRYSSFLYILFPSLRSSQRLITTYRT